MGGSACSGGGDKKKGRGKGIKGMKTGGSSSVDTRETLKVFHGGKAGVHAARSRQGGGANKKKTLANDRGVPAGTLRLSKACQVGKKKKRGREKEKAGRTRKKCMEKKVLTISNRDRTGKTEENRC